VKYSDGKLSVSGTVVIDVINKVSQILLFHSSLMTHYNNIQYKKLPVVTLSSINHKKSARLLDNMLG
jgi:hypothetical protein